MLTEKYQLVMHNILCLKIILKVDCLPYYWFQFYTYVLLRLPKSLNSFMILNILSYTWGVQVLRYSNFFFSGMEADRNVKVVGGDVAVL